VRVAVIVVSYRTGSSLWPALAAALAAAETAQLILVDNGNDAATRERLSAMAAAEPRLQLLTGHGNVGFARGCNLGAARAQAPFLLFMNPDCELGAGDMAALLAALEAAPQAWATAPLLVDAHGHVQPGTPRDALTPRSMLGEALRLDRMLPNSFPRLNRHRDRMPGEPFAVAACSGACLMIRRDRFQALGGFDEGYFLHVEDLDLCRRIADAGGRILCVPGVRVLHHGGTSATSVVAVERHKARGFVRYLRRHFRQLSRAALAALIALVWLRFAWRAAVLTLARRRRAA
jgi:GT2 family glycosyltransferase